MASPTLNFRTSKPQRFDHSPWHKDPRVCHFRGSCVTCGKRTYGFEDGQDDPRGPLGDRADSSLAARDYGYQGPDVPLCAICANEEERYNHALRIAKRRKWTPCAHRLNYVRHVAKGRVWYAAWECLDCNEVKRDYQFPFRSRSDD